MSSLNPVVGEVVEDPNEDELRVLLKSIAAQDEKAMGLFYHALESRTYRFIRSRLNDSFAAADILNETMLEVWKTAERFQGRSKVSTWLFSIANHKLIDYTRKQQRHQAEELDDSTIESEIEAPRDMLERIDDKQRISQCLEELTENHKAVLHLLFFEEMRYKEIAEIVDCPVGTVKTRVFHAKEALKQCLIKLV
jgi:RNA polymerase sigma-70 factor (ECF subfamily)